MSGRGRPLRFVMLVAAGWAGARVVILWPDGATLPKAIEEALPIHRAEASVSPALAPFTPAVCSGGLVAATFERLSVSAATLLRDRATGGDVRLLAADRRSAPQTLAAPPDGFPESMMRIPSAAPDAEPSRWSASAWFVTRRGAPAGGVTLGGDQAGGRIAYALDRGQRARAYVRATAPLAVAGREVAAGVEWQPTRLPVRVVAEHRVMLDGGGDGPAVGLIGGVSTNDLPLDFSLEAYGQAGAVFRARTEPFADGAVRAARDVASVGKLRLAVGAGIWGAAQREAARLDVGPSIVATAPVGDRAVRIAFDWRQRVAGDARPGSGPALTIGADF